VFRSKAAVVSGVIVACYLAIGILDSLHYRPRLEGSGILEESPNLAAYVARAKERPAYQRAFAAQRAVWEANKG